MAKKLALIDPDLLIRLVEGLRKNTPSQPPADPRLDEMTRLDDNMDDALLRQPENEADALHAMQKYNNQLQNFRLHHRQYKTDNYGADDVSATSERSADTWETEIIDSVPVTLRNRAQLLIRRIKNSNGELGWNTKGELTRRGVAVPGTNIVDLIGDVIRQRKTVKAPPGHIPFASGLRDINIPREAVGNKARLALVYGDATSDLSPPKTREWKTKRPAKRVIASKVKGWARF